MRRLNVRHWSTVVFLLVLARLLPSCTTLCEWQGERLGTNVAELKKQGDVQEARLEALQKKIAEAEKKQEEERRRARFLECRSNVARLRAAVEFRKAQCLGEIAEFNGCEASADKHRGVGTLVGCTLGVAATYVSVGALAWTLGGCAAGLAAGHVSSKGCKVPRCKAMLENIDAVVLRENKLRSIPRCGGTLGLTFKKQKRAARGAKVRGETRRETVVAAVEAGSPAEGAALRPGDVVTSVNSKKVTTQDEYLDELDTVMPGEQVVIRYYRKGRYHKVKLVVGER